MSKRCVCSAILSLIVRGVIGGRDVVVMVATQRVVTSVAHATNGEVYLTYSQQLEDKPAGHFALRSVLQGCKVHKQAKCGGRGASSFSSLFCQGKGT